MLTTTERAQTLSPRHKTRAPAAFCLRKVSNLWMFSVLSLVLQLFMQVYIEKGVMLAGKARRSGVTHMLHGCLGCRWTPAHKGGVPPRSAQYYRCGWYKDTHSAPQTAPAPSPRIGDAWSPSLTPGAPAATAGEPRAQEESNPAAWSLSSGWAAQRRLRNYENFRSLSDLFTFRTDCLLLFFPSLVPLCLLLLSLLSCLLPLTVLPVRSK